MTFREVLAQVIEWLQQNNRVSYRAIKREFDLDDDYLADLKDELIDIQQVAVDQDSRMLVWKGGASLPPLASPPSQPTQQPVTQPEQPTQAELPPTVLPTPDAERRQLTVMFCDLVESTKLSAQLDPEEYREVVRAYQSTCAEAIQRFDGHIAQYLGDGLLVYFGYPNAHEDDAQRAVRAALGSLAAMESLNTRLAVRVGIHTGPVVVGEMGSGGRHEQLALGETPNIAARLEGLAAPNQVVISAGTRRLVGGAFDFEDLGVHSLKGIAEPMPVSRVCGERAVESRFEAATTTGLTPLVGREEEISLVLRRWEQAKEGEGQVILLGGEPGIGKSRLTQTVRERVAEAPHICVWYQCSPYYSNSAFYPIMTQLERAAQFKQDDTPEQKCTKLEALLAQGTTQVADVAPLFAALLAIPSGDRYAPLSFSPQRQKEKTIAALVDQLVGLARRQPVLCIFEDAHWSDPTTLGVLNFAARLAQGRREAAVAQERAEAVLALSMEQGFGIYVAGSTIMRGWALAGQGQGEAGLAQMQQGLTAWQAAGSEGTTPYFFALLAETLRNIGQPEEGLRVLTQALDMVDRHGERFYEAETHRLRGELLLSQAAAHHAEAATCFHQALDVPVVSKLGRWSSAPR